MKIKLWIVKLKTLMIYGSILFLLSLLILRSSLVMQAVQKALFLCYKTVIPSLFPFLILSGLLTGGGFVQYLSKLLSPIMKPLFGVSGVGALPLLIGVISGYPMGAKITADLYSSGKLTKREAQKLLPFVNNAGPLFIIGAVGAGMLQNPGWGYFLYGVHIVSALIVGYCFRFLSAGNDHTTKDSLSPSFRQMPLFSEVVSGSCNTMLLICGFIIFFAASVACITPILDDYLPEKLSFLAKTLPEVTTGALLIAEAGFSPRLLLTLLSALIGFGGFCVALQVSGIVKPVGLSVKSYLAGKILQSCFSAVLTFFLSPFFIQSAAPVFAPAPIPEKNSLSFFSIFGVFIFLCLVCRKNRFRAVRKQKN